MVSTEMHPGCNFTLNYRPPSSTERNYQKWSFSLYLVFGFGHCSAVVAALPPRLADEIWKWNQRREKMSVCGVSGQGNRGAGRRMAQMCWQKDPAVSHPPCGTVTSTRSDQLRLFLSPCPGVSWPRAGSVQQLDQHWGLVSAGVC